MDQETETIKEINEDCKKARENIIDTEKEEGKSELVNKWISESKKKMDMAFRCLQKFKNDEKDKDSLADAKNNAFQARILSINALEKAKAVNLKKGLFYVKFNIFLLLSIFAIYVFSHWFWNIPWFKHDFWWEVIFFSLFGVLTNLTYSAAKHVLNRDFDIWHEGWYWSKIPQAPFLALALILFLKSVNIEALGVPINIGDAPEEVIISISYILGLFSRRAWEFIERIKDWLLPLNNNKVKN
jgi:hypothetical protein